MKAVDQRLRRASKTEIYGIVSLAFWTLYALTQIIVLYCVKGSFPVIYTVISAVGLAVAALPLFISEPPRARVLTLAHESYAIFWSAMHAFLIFGIMTDTAKYYFDITSAGLPQVVNIFIMIAFFWILYILIGNATWAVGTCNALIFALGCVNHYLLRFRGYPFTIADLSAIPTAVGVMGEYDFTPDALLVLTALDYIVWTVGTVFSVSAVRKCASSAGGRNRSGSVRRLFPVRWNRCTSVVSCIVAFGCLLLPFSVKCSVFGFQSDDYLYRLVAKSMSSATPPKDYSTSQVQQLAGEFIESEGQTGDEQPTVPSELPNIVVIMNESFSDLRVVGDFETDVPFLGFLDSLDENVIRGMTNVSVFGGGTANSEYEFLTSDTMAIYDEAFPYNLFFNIHDEYPGLALHLKNLGYETSAFHPYYRAGWSRPEVYSSMRFDHMTFLEDIDPEIDMLRDYVSDAGSYSYIKSWFENKEPGKPQFFFNVTMQNHGGYTYDGDDFETSVHITGDGAGLFPQTEQYLSLVKASDEAVADLLSWFKEYDEPVIVVMFGDHQPKVEDEFFEYASGTPMNELTAEQKLNMYKTPFFIWHNYETQTADVGDISLNYLAAMMLKDAGLPLTDYQKFSLSKYERFPVITQNAVVDAEGNIFERGTEEYNLRIYDYGILAYNHTVDRKNRLQTFFGSPLTIEADDETGETT